jgi:hypothetical protein
MSDVIRPPVEGNVRIRGPFGEDRGTYKHQGTDFGAQTPGVEHRDRLPRGWVMGPPVFAAACVAFVLFASTARGGETHGAHAHGRMVKRLEALPHRALPPGFFRGWCGLHDRFLIEVNERLEIYDSETKVATFPFVSEEFECTDDGERILFVDSHAGTAAEFDIPSRTRRELALYKRDLNPRLAISPDRKYLASDTSVELTSDAGAMTVLELSGFGGRPVFRVKWVRHSSSLLVVSDTDVVEVFNKNLHRISFGSVPKGFYYRDGWLSADGKVLLLYLGVVEDENGNGVIFKCELKGLKCRQRTRDVDNASVGRHGVLGIVLGLDKPPPIIDDDSDPLPGRYVVEIKSGNGRMLARQEFSFDDKPSLKLVIAPSGKKAVLTWDSNLTAQCSRGGGVGICETGIVIDLSGG